MSPEKVELSQPPPPLLGLNEEERKKGERKRFFLLFKKHFLFFPFLSFMIRSSSTKLFSLNSFSN